MNPRLGKQLFYGGVFLGIVFVVVAGAYFLKFREAPSCFDNKLNQDEEEVDCGGPCESCAVKHLQPIIASAEVIPIGDSLNIVIRFTNPNIFYGSPEFTYTLVLKDAAGNAAYSATKTGFIYPAEVQRTIIEANLPIRLSGLFLTPAVAVQDPSWVSVQEFNQPELAIRERS